MLHRTEAPAEYPRELNSLKWRLTNTFFGREEELANLHEFLSVGSNVIVVNGIGGIGKSSLAQKYVRNYIENYNHLLYVEMPHTFEIEQSGDNNEEDNFITSFVDEQDGSLLRNLNLRFEEKTPVKEKFNEILRKLHNIEGNNLLVIDNSSSVLTKFIDKLPGPPHWKLLITSRQKIDSSFELIELGVLAEPFAKELFYKYYKIEKEDSILKKLLVKIGYHTLTIELLAKSANTLRFKLAELIKKLEEQGLDFDESEPVKSFHHGNSAEPEKPFEHLLRTFVTGFLDEKSRELLMNFSVLPSLYIPYDTLMEILLVTDDNRRDFKRALNNLAGEGWISDSNNSFHCHQVIQEVARKQLMPDTENCKSLITCLAKKLSVDEAKDNPVEKFIWIEYGKSFLNHFPIENSDVAELANNLANLFRNSGDYTDAEELMEKVLVFEIANYGELHPSVATRRSNLALVKMDLGNYIVAEELMEKALSSDIKTYGEFHQSVAIRNANLAMIKTNLGHYSEAEELMERALASDIKNFGESDSAVVKGYSNLASIKKNLGEYKTAEELMEKAHMLATNIYCEDHPIVSTIRSNLALIKQALGDYRGAKELMEMALSSDIANYGELHPSVARSYSNLALIIMDLGKLNEAEILFEKSYICCLKLLGESHPNTQKVKGNWDELKRRMKEKGG